MSPIYRHSKKRNGPAPLIWIDVDDTILDFSGAQPSGVRAVERWARGHTDPDRARRLAAAFDRGFQLALSGWHGARPGAQENFRARLAPRLERILSEGPRPVRWTRELWLELAAEDAGVALTREQVAVGTREYWKGLAQAQRLYPYVVDTLRELRARGYRVALLSSSDCHLTPDPEGWRYDLEASRERKMLRLREVLRLVLPEVDELLLGDPYEKDGPEFYRHALERFPPEPGGIVVSVGDSLESDIQWAREADPDVVRYGVLCDPHGRYARQDDAAAEAEENGGQADARGDPGGVRAGGNRGAGAGPRARRVGADARIDQLPELLTYFF